MFSAVEGLETYSTRFFVEWTDGAGAPQSLELTPEVRASLVDWQQANRSGAHGVHRYTPEQFGLSAAQLRSDYDFYIRHFDVDVED